MPQTSKNLNHKQQDISRFKSLLNDLKRRFPKYFEQISEQSILIVSIEKQQLYHLNNQKLYTCYPISSAENGIGNQSGSNKTPLGVHRISEKFGKDAPIATIFKARQDTKKFAKIITTLDSRSGEDNITSRILCLDGLEEGLNKGLDQSTNNVDSHSRYIYIHGTDEEGRLGQAASHGCIRMANQDVIELFDEVEINCLVVITES